jgi:hypothetical protein
MQGQKGFIVDSRLLGKTKLNFFEPLRIHVLRQSQVV